MYEIKAKFQEFLVSYCLNNGNLSIVRKLNKSNIDLWTNGWRLWF